MAAIQPGTNLVAAFKTIRDGDTIIIPPGTYAGGVTLRGRRGIKISGPGAIITGGEVGLKVFGCQDTSIDGIAFIEAGQYGLMVQNSQGFAAQHCHALRNGTTGFLTASADDVAFLECEGSGSKTQHGLYVSQRCKKARIIGGTYDGNARSGIQINADSGGATDIEISGVHASGNQHTGGAAAIQCAYSVGGKITDCVITDHRGRSCIALWQHSRGFVIDGNRMEFAAGYGVDCIDLAKGSEAEIGKRNVPDERVLFVGRG